MPPDASSTSPGRTVGDSCPRRPHPRPWLDAGSAGSVIPMESARGEEEGVGGLAGLGGDMLRWGVA